MKASLSHFLYGLVLLLLVPGLAMAQNGTVEGTVTDAETQEPLPGATVQVVGTGIGTATDIEGSFSINLSPGTKQLRASFVGYGAVTQEVEIASEETSTLNFELSPSTAELGEVVVTGVTSETPKAKLSFTVEQVAAEQLERAPSSNAMEALQGKLAGASIQQSSGEPGSGYSVRLRATNSLTGDNAPLFIVDGVILGADQVDIGSLDIKNIEVVKGAAASSLYGSRAQNGVVNITTKRGSETQLGATRVTIRNEFGFQTLENTPVDNRSHSLLTNSEGQLINQNREPVNYGEGAAVDNSGPNGTSFRDNQFSELRTREGSPYQLNDAFGQFFEPGNTYTNYVAISQNSESTNFRASFENNVQGGVIQGPVESGGYQRRGFRVNLDHRPADNVSFAASAYYSQSQNDRLDAADFDPFFGLMFTSPLSNLLQRDADGELVIQPDPRSVEENPLYIVENTDINHERSRFLGSIRGEYSPFEWATFSGNLSYDRSDRDLSEFYKKGFKTVESDPKNTGETQTDNITQDALNYDVTLSLNNDFGDFTGRSQFKYQVERTELSSNFTQGNGLVAAGIPDFANVGDQQSILINSNNELIKAEGFYATAEGDYLDRYILDFLVRRDGSSLFGAEERWQTYFRAAGAWRVAQEPWWPLQDQVNAFKLRYSYGTAGARPDFEAQYETFELDQGNLQKNTLGNSALKPELQTEQEYGVELGLFNRLFFNFTYADSRVEDQLLEIPLIGPLGFSNQWQNAGTVESNTIELSVDADLIRTRDFAWNLGLTFDRTRQEITEFNANAFRAGPEDIFYYRGGETIGAMYGNKWISSTNELQTMGFDPDYFQKNDDGYMVPVGVGNTWADGFEKDLWGTNVNVPVGEEGTQALTWGHPVMFTESDGNQFVQIGNTVPNFNTNLSTNFRFKNLSAYALLSYMDGADAYNFTKQWSYRDGRNADQDEFGKPEGEKKPNSYYEKLYQATNKNSHFVEDATFLKIREVSLQYTFDQALLNSLLGSANVLQRLNLSLTGRNLFTFTDYSGVDPEVGDGDDATLFRVDNFDYPHFRTFTGRIEFQF
jgi:TonB-linked SusC/RagA family outer membrane protein